MTGGDTKPRLLLAEAEAFGIAVLRFVLLSQRLVNERLLALLKRADCLSGVSESLSERDQEMTARILAPSVPSWMATAGRQLRRLSDGKLPVAQITQQDLLSHPTGYPIRRHSLALLLDWRGTLHDDKAFLSSRIPWLWDLPRPWTAIRDLWQSGLVVLTSDDHQIISTLAGTVLADERLVVQIFTCPWSPENG